MWYGSTRWGICCVLLCLKLSYAAGPMSASSTLLCNWPSAHDPRSHAQASLDTRCRCGCLLELGTYTRERNG
ncbi:hypothetical protein FB451DRAFT_1235539 [Mycena latifolia]|nr:hypothetical protein FB451DRAFT_1235539 [Mycena latifolia]